MTRIKICGLFRPADADYANEALPDYIGFVFAESRRKVMPVQAAEIKQRLDARIKVVGVFVDAELDDVAALVRDGVIDVIQLHGGEDAAYIERLRAKTDALIVKAVRVQTQEQVLAAQQLPCDYLLLDAYHPDKPGGVGERFDWALLPALEKPYFLAGGINLENIREALKLRPYGIDVSSGAETDGVKDKDKIIELVNIVRSVAI
jgi:phosphoribosylanthranilate isomerase